MDNQTISGIYLLVGAGVQWYCANKYKDSVYMASGNVLMWLGLALILENFI